jgi:cyclopropane-fatty-acyl-phospholipid synthase
VSNSASQKQYIDAQCSVRGLANVTVFTRNINDLDGASVGAGAGSAGFDRVVSVECMEHLKNYDLLLRRVASWMRPGGLFFVHIFTHRSTPFHYVDGWMAEKFFTGGQMPSDDLLLYFQRDLRIADHWVVDGSHYERTCNRWLENMDANRAKVMPVLEGVYGKRDALQWFANWRLFFISCAELFGFEGGGEWFVSHYLFEKGGAENA